jgi:uncharacterized protein YdhG (YjbR/CyaY superfamily)
VSPIDAYLNALKGPRKAALQKLRKQIRSVVPRAEECISYRIPAFRLEGAIVAGFLARKDGCSYVPFSGSTLGTLQKELKGYSQTKSSLHFDADGGLPLALVRKLVKARLVEISERGK